jgi:hypothetical protein
MFSPASKTAPPGRWVLLLALAAALAGCRREEIAVYRAPKEEAMPGVAAAPAEVGWKLPPGWKELPGDEINLKNFAVPGPNGGETRGSITRLPSLSGREAMLVNMWRAAAGAKAVGEEAALKELQPVAFGAEAGLFFEVAGTHEVEARGQTNRQPVMILTAFVHHPDGSWFCKLAGEPALVEEQKPVFMEFLKSITFTETSPEPAPAVTGQFHWQVPAGWQAAPPGEMQQARFAVPEKNGAKAEVTVSIFPTDTGGTLANIVRWRRQMGLGPVAENDLAQLISPLDPAIPGAILTDMSNGGKQLIGAIVPRAGRYWFYKLQGDAAAVAPEKGPFIAFVKSPP